MSDRNEHESAQERDAADGEQYQQEGLLREEGDALVPDPHAQGDEDFLPSDMGEATSHPPDESPSSNQ